MRDIWKHWTVVSTLLGLINSVYRDLPNWKSNQWPQIVEAKLYLWAINPHHTQVEVTVSSVKSMDVTLQDTFRSIGHAITMTSWLSITFVQCRLVAQR